MYRPSAPCASLSFDAEAWTAALAAGAREGLRLSAILMEGSPNKRVTKGLASPSGVSRRLPEEVDRRPFLDLGDSPRNLLLEGRHRGHGPVLDAGVHQQHPVHPAGQVLDPGRDPVHSAVLGITEAVLGPPDAV